jgi:hypothetical protein
MPRTVIDERSGSTVESRDGHEPAPSRDPGFRVLARPQRPPGTTDPAPYGEAGDGGLRRVPRKGLRP